MKSFDDQFYDILPEEYDSFFEELEMGVVLKNNKETEEKRIYENMKAEIAKCNYSDAFRLSQDLRKRNYGEYKKEIEEVVKICADHDTFDALLCITHKYVNRYSIHDIGPVFPYIKKLANQGYIDSFRYLADSYFYGIGCAKDLKKAEYYYSIGYIFGHNAYCRMMCLEYFFREDDFDLINPAKKIFEDCVYSNYTGSAQAKLADEILKGRIKELDSYSAYIILRNAYKADWEGLITHQLGVYLLYGIGTDENPIVALHLFEDAGWDLEATISYMEENPDDEYCLDPYFDLKDYQNAYEENKKMILFLEDKIKKMDDKELLEQYEEDYRNPEKIFLKWKNEDPKFLNRFHKLRLNGDL